MVLALDTARPSGPGTRLSGLLPGIAVSVAAGGAAILLARTLGGPAMLYAIVFGMALNPVAHGPAMQDGVTLCAKTVLNIGVALLGVKIALSDIAGLGWETVALVLAGVSGTILSGIAVGRWLGLKRSHAVLSSGAVAICGASAAMALCAALPRDVDSERNTLVTVMGVTLLGTLAMVAYPAAAHALGLSDTQAGLFIGATIHNVAQVVGAGYMLSDPVGDTATVVKLMRVACLLPVVMIVTLAVRAKPAANGAECGGKRPALVPGFLMGFAGLMALNSSGLVPAVAADALSDLSGYALILAIAALGVKTSVRELICAGGSACTLLVVQTLGLGLVVAAVVTFAPAFA